KITIIGSGALFYKDLLTQETETIKSVHIPESNLEEHNKDPHIVHPLGMLSLLEQKNIDDINYLKPSYAELKAIQK
ncbi:MAG: hypothetical protein NTY22_05345, partial [Proteobacteria bacterium]|nr:hypothetical protein [Pseudomonadota bacterium]